MRTIGVMGASGQVGTELCLFLGLFPGVRVVALCRTDLSAAMLRRCGVECRIGDLTSAERARPLLAGCDLVFDLSRPKGLVHDVQTRTSRTIAAAVSGSEPDARYVFASTLMAFGHPMVPGAPLRWHFLSRTAYGANKRAAERAARRSGRRSGRPVWVLRLGQVHGEMQGISRTLLATVDAVPTYAPDRPSNTVFVFTIAEALARIAEGREPPGTYSLVSRPQWSWRELYAHYARLRGVTPTIVGGAAGERMAERPDSAGAAASAVRARLGGPLLAALARRRDLLNAYVLKRVPTLEWSAKATWLRRSAIDQIRRGERERVRDITTLAGAFSGEPPGAQLSSLSDSRATMEPVASQVRERLRRLVPSVVDEPAGL